MKSWISAYLRDQKGALDSIPVPAVERMISLLKAKLAEEILAIEKFREALVRLEGDEVSEEEAARQWIAKHAKKFGDLFKAS